MQSTSDNFEQAEFQVYQCSHTDCGLRFSAALEESVAHCPTCHSPLVKVGAPYPRAVVNLTTALQQSPQVEILLDNIRSAWNVGSILRSADGAGVRQVHLSGVSATPDNAKVAKTALGAERSLPWQHVSDAVALVDCLKAAGMRIWALEGGPQAVSLFDLRAELPGPPLLLVVGNELTGVDPGVLARCDRVVGLPMAGIKDSLNVAVAFGAAVYFIRYGGSASE